MSPSGPSHDGRCQSRAGAGDHQSEASAREEVEYILKQGEVQALFFMAQVRTYDHLATLHLDLSRGQARRSHERAPAEVALSLPDGMPPSGLLEQEDWHPTLLSEVSARAVR